LQYYLDAESIASEKHATKLALNKYQQMLFMFKHVAFITLFY